jgi:hypothetical protein
MGNYVQAVPLYQEALQQEIQAIESKLATSFATAGQTRRALGVTTEQIVATLPSDTISISWLRSRRLNMSLLERDLLESTELTTSRDCVFLANPDFQNPLLVRAGAVQSDTIKRRGTEMRGLEDLHFESLAGAATEVKQLEKQLQSWSWNSVTLTDNNATKAALLRVQRPYVLHLATHGFFESIDSENADSPTTLEPEENQFKSKYFDNPMHRSGLALAGANLTLAAWRDNKEVQLENDGILTAEDASTLDLQGTWLVTLSACDTGEGEANAGEGVMGLRRGFLEAGAQNLLMTLWPIADRYTVELMKDFYSRAHQSGNAPLALAEVQRDWLVKLRKEKGLAQAVRLAGPFILSFRGKPT